MTTYKPYGIKEVQELLRQGDIFHCFSRHLQHCAIRQEHLQTQYLKTGMIVISHSETGHLFCKKVPQRDRAQILRHRSHMQTTLKLVSQEPVQVMLEAALEQENLLMSLVAQLTPSASCGRRCKLPSNGLYQQPIFCAASSSSNTPQ